MRCLTLLVFFCFGLVANAQPNPEWKPAAGPLLTKWAKDVDPSKVLPEHPRPQMMGRPWMNLNGIWDYYIAAQAAPEKPSTTFKKILVPFPIESALSGVMERLKPDELIRYRRQFVLPENFKGKRVLLHFGAVDWENLVIVNGKIVGPHRGGFDPFTFDITDALKPAGKQLLEVDVIDPTDADHSRAASR
jgi:beta-galactosidase/beta-glucuronidase